VFELNTAISNLDELQRSDLDPYDAVYLGNMYCRLYEGNLLGRPMRLREAVHRVRDLGKRAYLTTYAAPRQDDLTAVRRALETGVEAGAVAVEVHGPGLLKIVRDEFPGLAAHLGSFANVYTDLGVETLKAFGAARLTPSHELTLDEIDQIARDSGVPLELAIHGKIPLGVSETCLLLHLEASWGVRCPDLCRQDVFLRKEDWGMKSVGTGVLSGRDVCMLEHLPRLVAGGHRHFRIEAVSEGPTYRRAVGAVYREALTRAFCGTYTVEDGWWEPLRTHTRLGFCDGFYFGRSGMDYVGGRSTPHDDSTEDE